MKVPAKFKQWPTLYRYGYEDGERGDANVGDRFTAGRARLTRQGTIWLPRNLLQSTLETFLPPLLQYVR